MERLDDLSIRRIFGSEDAESEEPERLKEYFLYNGAYRDLRTQLPLRIVVGHKGTGKSALLKRSYLDDIENSQLAIEIKPNDISELMVSLPDESFIQKIERWKTGIKRISAEKAVNSLLEKSVDSIDSKNEIFKNVALSSTEFIRKVIEFIRPSVNDKLNAAIADSFLKDGAITIYIDDIDRGWSASPADISNISALINAVRDLCNADRNFQCRIALRTDVYFLVRTSDESTDKIEQDIIRLQWTNDEILRMISLRIITYFKLPLVNDLSNLNQARISREILSQVMGPVYHGRGLWTEVPISVPLMSLCRKRPRDLVKLLHGAARVAGRDGRSKINQSDFDKSFELYSDERLQDLVNEFKSEMPMLGQVLLRFKPAKMKNRAADSFRFTTDAVIIKINNIKSNLNINFTSKRIVSSKEILGFLYKIDFLIARTEDDNGKAHFSYFDQHRFLANEAVDFGYQWEVHPAYRWALQPNDVQSIINQIPDMTN